LTFSTSLSKIIYMCISEHSPNGWRKSLHASCSPIIHAG
jgi:hypothetical protein